VAVAVNSDTTTAAFIYASESVRNNKDIAFAAVTRHHDLLRHVSHELRADREFALSIIRQNGCAIQWLPDELSQVRTIAMVAVETTGEALQYLSTMYRADLNIVDVATIKPGCEHVLQFASAKIKNIKTFVLTLVTRSGRAIQHASNKLKSDEDVVLAAVSQCGAAIFDVPLKFRSNKKIMMAAVRSCGSLLQVASAELRNDLDVTLAAVGKDGTSIWFASNALSHNIQLALRAVITSPSALYFMHARSIMLDTKVLCTVSAKTSGATNTMSAAKLYRLKGLGAEYAQFIRWLKVTGRALYTRRLLRNFGASPGRRPISEYMLIRVLAYVGVPPKDLLSYVDASITSMINAHVTR